MSTHEVIRQAFRHFVHLDEANAAIHTAPVRYSPLTFRLAEVLHASGDRDDEVARVIGDQGTYEEDPGR